MSAYSCDSLMLMLHNGNWFNFHFTHEEISFLTTTNLDGLLPGLVDKYGKD
jgi:hypothetical protein